MKRLILLFILISIFRMPITFALKFSARDGTNTEVLINGPIILIGKVESLVHSGDDVLKSGSLIKVQIFNASVTVFETLKGKNIGKTVVIKNLMKAENPDTWIGRQFPEKDKIYFFFLSPGNSDNEFIGISPTEFAIETVDLAGKDKPEKEVKNYLRWAAKINIDGDNEQSARRWFEILGDIYNEDKDVEYCKKKIYDTRILIRGCAIVILCDKSPAVENLYSDTMLFFKDSQMNSKTALLRREISRKLPNIFIKDGINDKIINEWMESEAKELQQVALSIAEKEKRSSAIDSIETLMLKTKDQSIQYNCYKTLCAMADKKNYPAWKPFFESKEKYIKEIQDLISNQKQNK